MRLITISGTSAAKDNDWLTHAERVHRQLRPRLPSDYHEKMARVFAGGARMLVALADDDDSEASPIVLGLAVWRVYEDTANGIKLYVDDLVTDEVVRSSGVGRALIDW